MDMQQDMIVILDLGSHENTMVARAVRELGVYSEIKPHDITAAELKELPNVKGIIINGGENNIIDGLPIDVEAAGEAPANKGKKKSVKARLDKSDEEAINAAKAAAFIKEDEEA